MSDDCWKCGAPNAEFASFFGPNDAWRRYACSERCADEWFDSKERSDLSAAYWAGVRAQHKQPSLIREIAEETMVAKDGGE